MVDFEDNDRIEEENRKSLEQVRTEISILKCEILQQLKVEYPAFIEKHGLQQFDRLKRPKLQKITQTEARIYAYLHGSSVRKATAIIRKFNAYIALMRENREPAETMIWLTGRGMNLN